MSLFDNLLDSAFQAQIARIQADADKANREKKRFKFAAYRGKDPIDGTDIVQVDGDEPTSGFQLISNAPLREGDRVYLHPNTSGGLQRVDAKNVAVLSPIIPTNNILIKILFLVGNKLYIGGDRKESELIYEAPSGYTIITPSLSSDSFPILGHNPVLANTGLGLDDWICQFIIHESDTINQVAVAINSIGVVYSKQFEYTNIIYPYSGIAQVGNYGYFQNVSFHAYNTYGEPFYDEDSNYIEPIDFAQIQWQSFFIDLANDNFNNGDPIDSKYLEINPIYPTDAQALDYINVSVFDNNLSSLIYLETVSNILYYGVFDALLVMGEGQNDCLMFHRDPTFYIDWYIKGNPSPIRFPYASFTLEGSRLLEDEYSPNQRGSLVSVAKKTFPSNSKVDIVSMKLSLDATLTTVTQAYDYLGVGSMAESAIVDVSAFL